MREWCQWCHSDVFIVNFQHVIAGWVKTLYFVLSQRVAWVGSKILCDRPNWKLIEAATRGVLKKKLFLKISQYPQESTCVGVFFQ